jgi:F-type H+-transporting ATPase subunit epsilon
MAKPFHCRVITPEARILDEEVTSAVVPMHDGQMGFLAERAPIVGKLGYGELRLTFTKGGVRSYLVESGFAQMVGDRLTVLAERATPAENLSEPDAQAELSEAMSRVPKDADDRKRISKDLERARAKVGVARAFKARGGGI